jgi:CcmD family protein
MGDLVYAAIVILVIWGGIFFYLVTLDRRVRALEGSEAGATSDDEGSRVVSGPATSPASAGPAVPPDPAEVATTAPEAREEPAEPTGGDENAGEEAAIE